MLRPLTLELWTWSLPLCSCGASCKLYRPSDGVGWVLFDGVQLPGMKTQSPTSTVMNAVYKHLPNRVGTVARMLWLHCLNFYEWEGGGGRGGGGRGEGGRGEGGRGEGGRGEGGGGRGEGGRGRGGRGGQDFSPSPPTLRRTAVRLRQTMMEPSTGRCIQAMAPRTGVRLCQTTVEPAIGRCI